MHLSTDKLIEEYYNSRKQEYPEINPDDFIRICKIPFEYIMNKMKSSLFPLIHIKYFGKFIVFPGKVRSYLRHCEKALDKGDMTKEEFEEETKPLKDFLTLEDEKISS